MGTSVSSCPEPAPGPPRLLLHNGAGVVVLPRRHRGRDALPQHVAEVRARPQL